MAEITIQQVAALLKSRDLPAEVRSNGETDSIVVEALDGQRLAFAFGDPATNKGWGYTLVGADGLVEVGWLDDLSDDPSAEEVASNIIENIDFIFDAE